MQVSTAILSNVKHAILETHSLGTFIPFADEFSAESGVNFQNDVAAGSYNETVYNYLTLLNNKGKVLPFVRAYISRLNDSQIKFSSVVKIREAVEKGFMDDAGVWKVSPLNFNCFLIKNHFAFLDRKPVREAVKRMINENDSPVLIINGKAKAGLSYTRLYLSEIEANISPFKLINIDLKKDVAGYASGLVYAAHLAQCIADCINMPYEVDLGRAELFKIAPFVNKVKIFLDNEEQLHLFFIDQFDIPLADDVFSLITGLAELPVDNYPILLVLSGYNKDGDWDFMLEHISNKVDIENGSLTKEHVDEFFDHVFEELSSRPAGITFSKEEFLSTVSSVITDEHYSTPGTNVGIIGQRLSKWYKNLSVKLEQNA